MPEMAFGGLRWGEAVSLRRRDVDLERERLIVPRSLVERPGGRFLFNGTKTDRARTVGLPSGVVDRFRHLSEIPTDQETLVFTSSQCRPLRRSILNRRYWRPALSRAGLEKGHASRPSTSRGETCAWWWRLDWTARKRDHSVTFKRPIATSPSRPSSAGF